MADIRRNKHQQRPLQQIPAVAQIRLKSGTFWFVAAGIAIILVAIMAQDITKPFIELHSWGRAHDAWVARSNVVYGLSYTKGFDTFAVGNPPPKEPTRYLDHPVLFTLIDSAAMYALGVNEWSLRVMNIVCTIIALLIFIKIIRHLADDVTALLAGLFFCLFPLIAFFGVNMWLYPLVLAAYWCYLSIIGILKDAPAKKWHRPVLAITLFLAIQMTWEGFFFAMAIGIHYVFRCIKSKKMPDWGLFLILAIAPLASLALDFIVLAAGHNWDFKRLYDLAKIRATAGEMGTLIWERWFGRFIDHALTNFSLPVMIASVFGIIIGLLYSHNRQKDCPYSLRCPQFWLFFMPAFFQLTLLRGTLWPHQYWERPVVLIAAVATATAIMIFFDIIRKFGKAISVGLTAAVTIALCWGCFYGIQYYYGIRWQNPAEIEMYKYLKKLIPPDKELLCFESHTIDQFPGIKAASLRPEIAWYLDRDIVKAEQLPEIVQQAQTGKFPYYLALLPCEMFSKDANTYFAKLNAELAKRYKLVKTYSYIPWKPKKPPWMNKEDFFIRGMFPQAIYELTANASK
jgi:hypothetical protein